MPDSPPDFTETVDEGMDDFEADPFDFGNHLLRRQQGGSAPAAGGDGEDLQTSVMAAIVRAASDMHSVKPLKFNIPVDMKAEEQLKASSAQIRVGLINRMRNDVALPDARGASRSSKTLEWHKTELTNTLVWSGSAADYKPEDWQNSLLSGIGAALEQKANIICLGEFDYPPFFPDKVHKKEVDPEERFNDSIIDLINGVEHPVFLFAGSSHSCQSHSSTYRGKAIGEFSAENIGRVFYNDALMKGIIKPTYEHPLCIAKRTPASKIGERLSRPPTIDISTFKTLFGHVLILICADAYDPSIILEVFSHSSQDERRADIIIVPAYNMSPKFAQVCQLLSILADSIVILLDVCTATSGGPKTTMEIWNCGWRSGEGGGLSSIQSTDVRVGKLGICELDLDAAKDFQDTFGLRTSMPFFAAARTLVNKPVG